jgi:hypothetical protein
MRISLVDKSNYYKGLLILTGRDRIIDKRERELMLQIGAKLDFEKRFCEAAITDLLDNKYITDEPIIFEEREIAECFLRDAIGLALVDQEMHPHEITWLRSVARINKITDDWLDNESQRLQENKCLTDQPAYLHIQRYL